MEEVLYLLREHEVLYTFDHQKVTFYQLKEDHILVYGPSVHYFLLLEEFMDLFQKQSFFLYTASLEEKDISLQKDEEYYRWKNK